MSQVKRPISGVVQQIREHLNDVENGEFAFTSRLWVELDALITQDPDVLALLQRIYDEDENPHPPGIKWVLALVQLLAELRA